MIERKKKGDQLWPHRLSHRQHRKKRKKGKKKKKTFRMVRKCATGQLCHMTILTNHHMVLKSPIKRRNKQHGTYYLILDGHCKNTSQSNQKTDPMIQQEAFSNSS